MEIILDGKKIITEDDFYNELCKQHEGFGPYFGRNLYAFRDCVELLEGCNILWEYSEMSRNKLGKSFIYILNVINNHNNEIVSSNRDKRLLICLHLK